MKSEGINKNLYLCERGVIRMRIRPRLVVGPIVVVQMLYKMANMNDENKG